MSFMVAALVIAAGFATRSALLASRWGFAARRLPNSRNPTERETVAPCWFVTATERAGMVGPSSPQTWWHRLLAAALAVVLIGSMFATVIVGVLLAVGLFASVAASLWALRDRGAQRYQDSLPVVLDDLAGQIRSGSSLMQALDTTCGAVSSIGAASPTADLAVLVERCRRGGTLTGQLDHWHEKRPLPAVALAVTALGVATVSGGNQARALDAVAATIRERTQLQREQHSLATQARASAAVMVVVPLVFAVLAASIDPRVGHVLVATPLGLGCLALGLLLDVGAAAWMARITGVRT